MSFVASDCACVVVNTRSRRKAFNKRLLLSAAAIALIAPSTAQANPVGAAVTTGSASISTSSSKTNVNQKSEDVVINWSSFNIGSGQTTQFYQPNAQAIAVNRVGGANASQILGTLDANGRVVLINGNGVLFGKGAQVNAGSLIATSTDGSDSDVLSGNFTKAGKQTASVINNGAITAASGGVVALVAPNVTNTGTVNAKLGTVALGAANKFTVDFSGDGLVSFAAQGDVNARAAAINSGLLSGANVSMTAHAANGIATGIVNMSGIITAQSVQDIGGTIVLDGGQGGSINIGGKLDASGTKSGGLIAVGGWDDAAVAVSGAAMLNASATQTGNGGHVSVIAQKNTFAGTAQARGGISGGDGGVIETSGDSVAFTGSHVDAHAYAGKSGTWLLDPVDEIIDPTDAATVSAALVNESVEFLTNATNCAGWGSCVSGQGDIDIEGAITWNNSNSLTISAWHSINIMAPITATGPGSMTITYGHDGSGGSLNFGAPASGSGNIAFTDVSSGTTLGNLSIQGANYVLANSISQLASDVGANANGLYALADSFDAGGTTYSGSPTGNGTFGGTFEGLGNTISNLKISNSSAFSLNYGLFSQVSGTVADLALANVDFSITGAPSNDGSVGAVAGDLTGTLRNVAVTGVVDGNMNGGESGMLVGEMDSGQILESMSAGTLVGGNTAVGGLTGSFGSGTIQGSFSTTDISSDGYSGGLIGEMNGGNLTDSYSAGSVQGRFAGGLAGFANSGMIATSYATGYVSGTTAGGLVGVDDGGNTYTDDVWNTQTTGQATSPGGTGESTAQLQAALPSGFSSATWSILPGTSNPYLSSQFSGTPQVLSGYAFDGTGTNALNAGTVTVDANGSSFATLNTGANGYFYDLVAPGTFTTNEPLLAYTTGANNGAHVEAFSGNATGFDIWGNTLIAPSSDTTYSSASGTSLQTQDASLIAAAVGSDSNASFVTGLTNFGYVGTGASFTVDQSLSLANGLFVETRNGNLTVADPITLAGTNGLTLYSSKDLTIDAAVNVTDGGSVALAAGYDTTTVPGTPLLELSFGLGPNGFAGNLNYAAGSGEGISGQSLAINGVNYTLLYSMTDVQSINCSFDSYDCSGAAASTSLTGNYALANSLNASGFGFNAIGVGVPGDEYTGIFEGLGHTISNLSFANLNPPAGQGLFSGSAGTIRDIGMVGGSVCCGGSNGFLVGVDAGVIENTFETGTVQSDSFNDPSTFTGGLVGVATGSAVIANSFATGQITKVLNDAGGLVGDLQGGTLVDDYATISVVTAFSGYGSDFGGLVGEADSGSRIENSYATGAVTGHQDIGGLVGYLDGGSISNSFATGAVSGTYDVGGLVGESEEGAIANSYAMGSVSGTSVVGGLVGALFDPSSSVTDSFSIGRVTGSSIVGGLVGEQSDSGGVTDSYWDTETSGIGSDGAGAVPLTTAAMQGTFTNMPGFAGPTWATGTGLFPYLSWQFSGTPQAVSGKVFSGSTEVAGENVGLLVNGTATAPAFYTTSGADGYYYLLLAPGTVSGSDVIVYLTSGTPANTFVQDATGTHGDVDLFENTFVAASHASDSAAILAELPTALGSASGSQFLYTAASGVVSGVNLVIYDTAPAFTLDSSLDVGNAILELYTTGSDTQTSGTITANQLISTSTGGLSLGDNNAIANLGVVGNSGAGGISVTDAQALTVAGNLSTGTGDIDLTTTGSGNGIAIDDHLVGGTVDLVSAGTIRENGTNGFIHASELEGSSDGYAFFNEANKIGALGDFSTGSAGAFSLYNWATLDETGLLNTGKHSITLDTQIGDLEIGGALLGGTISLTSLAGEVQGAGIIDAKLLNVSASTGIDLYGTNNDIQSIGTDTTNSGPNIINTN